MAKKLVLDIELEADFDLIGIVSPIKDYRLMFFLNKSLKYHFKRLMPFTYESKDGEVDYSMYHYHDEDNHISLYLIANRKDGQVLIPEYKQIDYVMIFDGELNEEFRKDILKKIKGIPHVRMAMDVLAEKIKTYDEIASQLEMCFSELTV